MSIGVGGRAICVSLLEKADQIHEDEERASSDNLFEDGGLEPLYQSLHSSDETISPHQITLLKLLDGYIDVQPRACESSPSLSAFLPNTLLTLLQTTKSWTSVDTSSEAELALNENLPQVSIATVLVSQMLSNVLMAEQTVWENAIVKENWTTYTGNASKHIYEANAPPTDKASLPASRFELQKRDLVRLLGILVHDDPNIQTRVREAGGVQVVLGLCAIDESNPFIREHALFTLRNLLYKNSDNQRIVQEMEPMGKIDENGILRGI
ncbi:hypothetical protein RHS01_03524 [Rhizoctonia solani]|uniref:Ataxin-10 homolog n=1 Tax=Rhizoctonia solani TaxID=456999 RepID=A0A8H7IIA5_9AGAM|nr:hypothetical protein RHS01_03524 [Rhizoctonia solani]